MEEHTQRLWFARPQREKCVPGVRPIVRRTGRAGCSGGGAHLFGAFAQQHRCQVDRLGLRLVAAHEELEGLDQPPCSRAGPGADAFGRVFVRAWLFGVRLGAQTKRTRRVGVRCG